MASCFWGSTRQAPPYPSTKLLRVSATSLRTSDRQALVGPFIVELFTVDRFDRSPSVVIHPVLFVTEEELPTPDRVAQAMTRTIRPRVSPEGVLAPAPRADWLEYLRVSPASNAAARRELGSRESVSVAPHQALGDGIELRDYSPCGGLLRRASLDPDEPLSWRNIRLYGPRACGGRLTPPNP